MTIGLIGRKAGMTRVFTDAGESIPVTVIEALPNRVTQVKGVEGDGYRAVQVAFGDRKPSRLSRPLAGHYAKSKVSPGESLVEFRLADGTLARNRPQPNTLWLDDLYMGTRKYTREEFLGLFNRADLPAPELIDLPSGATLLLAARGG